MPRSYEVKVLAIVVRSRCDKMSLTVSYQCSARSVCADSESVRDLAELGYLPHDIDPLSKRGAHEIICGC